MEVFEKVKAALVEALNVEPEDIELGTTLQGQLGAESIDMLDITFRLEREFNIKIPRDELFPDGIFSDDPTCVKDGRVTPEGIEKLKQALPHSDFVKFEQNPTIANIQELFTVGTLVNYVQSKLG